MFPYPLRSHIQSTKLHVRLEAALVGKLAGARRTLKGLDVEVHVHVPYIVPFHQKTFAAHFAAEVRVVSVVLPNVGLPPMRGFEKRVTPLALEQRSGLTAWVRVCAGGPELQGVRQTSSTLLTAALPLPGRL